TPDATECANPTTITVDVTPKVDPTFAPIPAICEGGTFTLPTTSTNGISGTWSPAIDNTTTTTYTFTPDATECANPTTITVDVTPKVDPTFAPIPAICEGGTFTLPTTSTNGISGTWSPAIDNTTTTTYTFTPDATECANPTTITVDVTPKVDPTFAPIPAICEGGTFTLPTTSTNGISGTWSPAIDNTTTTTYTFTPDATECANPTTITVDVTPKVDPTFAPIPAICEGGTFTLPTTSTNGISGTWSPAIDNTTTTTYTFTPDATECANPTTITVDVTPKVDPTFAPIPAICEGGTFTLPTTSTNGISGTWSPAIDNTTTTTYTFTPDATECADPTTITVNVTQKVDPTFAPIPAICEGGTFTLPTTSTNGISGTWSPAIDNTTTTTYTFMPDATECANPTTITVDVTPKVDPTFAPIPAICEGGTFTLPTTSTNGISGTWSPAIDNTTTTTYTFTPDATECANPTTITVDVTPKVDPTF